MSKTNIRPAPRSALCVPGDQPGKLEKAFATDADQIVVDLEDAVAPHRKAIARETVAAFLAGADLRRTTVRINAVDTPWWHDDLAAIAEAAPQLESIVLPKAERLSDALELEEAASRLAFDNPSGSTLRIQALIETAVGVRDLSGLLAGCGSIDSVIIGYADLAVDLRRPVGLPGGRAWLALQDRVVVIARAAGVAAIDGPWFDFRDRDSCVAANEHAAAMGFDGKWVIHPAQVDDVNESFTPSQAAVEHAKRVIEAFGDAVSSGTGAVGLEGAMIDLPVVEAARQVVKRAEASRR